MEKVIVISEVMTTGLQTLKPEMPIFRAIETLLKHRISGAPVLSDEGELIGMLSEKDCLRVFVNEAFFSEKAAGRVAEYMTRNVITVNANDDVFKIAGIFLKNSFRRLPVMKDGKLVGQVSRRDVLLASMKMIAESPVKKGWTDSVYISEEIKAALADKPADSLDD